MVYVDFDGDGYLDKQDLISTVKVGKPSSAPCLVMLVTRGLDAIFRFSAFLHRVLPTCSLIPARPSLPSSFPIYGHC